MSATLPATLTPGPGERETPPEVFDPLHAVYRFDFDAAALPENAKLAVYIDPAADTLTADWREYGRTAWLNPPYGRQIGAFLDRAAFWTAHGITTVALVPARPDTRWWREHVAATPAAREVHFLPGRIKFRRDGAPIVDAAGRAMGAPFPSAIVVYAPPMPLPSWRAR